jgi:hypothetical protein
MALNATTVSAAINSSNNTFGVASATGVTAPNFTTGTGVTYALCESEMMIVTGVTGTFISVIRGQLGTAASSHAASAPILFGLAADFPTFTAPGASTRFRDFSAPVAGANTNVATGTYFHLTGTVIMKTLTPIAGFVGGEVNIVFDGSAAGLTWDATGNINVAGTAGTAGTMVTFTYDPSISKWIPSRIL